MRTRVLALVLAIPALAHRHHHDQAAPWKDVGCYSATSVLPSLTVELNDQKATAETCQTACADHKFAGLKGTACVCADKVMPTFMKLQQEACDSENEEAMQLYRQRHFHKQHPLPVMMETMQQVESIVKEAIHVDSQQESANSFHHEYVSEPYSPDHPRHHSHHHCHRHHQHFIMASFGALAFIMIMATWNRRRQQYLQLDVEAVPTVAPYNHQYKVMTQQYDYPGQHVQPVMQQKQ